MTFSEPSFPPLLDGRIVIKGDSPRLLAIAGAEAGELGAGDTLWLQDTAKVELAVILEPDDPLSRAVQMLPLAVAAAGECLAALTPPQVGLHFRWPATLLLNGAAAGRCDLTVPAACFPDELPRWMVLTFTLRFHHDEAAEPGNTPGITSLAEEGGDELTTVDVIDSFSRHFLSLLDTWHNEGFAGVAETWSGHLEGRESTVTIHHPGQTLEARALGLDEDGNLLVKPEGSSQTTALALLDCITRQPDQPASAAS